jgi:adenylate cyclase
MTPDQSISLLVVAIVSFGMACGFFWADWRTSTSRALVLTLTMISLTLVAAFVGLREPSKLVGGLFLSLQALSLMTGIQWGERVAATRKTDTVSLWTSKRVLRVAQGLALFSALIGPFLPFAHSQEFTMRPLPDLSSLPYILYVTPMFVAFVLMQIATLVVARSKIDQSERIRMAAGWVALPILFAALFVAPEYTAVLMATGLMVFLAGAIKYHVTQGERGQFMERFLSPDVAAKVGRHGMRDLFEMKRYEMSVLFCDLSGFTSYSDAHSSRDVMRLLKQYYQAVGEVVVKHGGTVKDHAGDGVMVLVGAPTRLDDHAERVIAIADELLIVVRKLLVEWSSKNQPLDVGIGVASGYVTVGAISAATRLEYVAIGQTVNLASRLEEAVVKGPMLVSLATIDYLEPSARAGWKRTKELHLKGFADPVIACYRA